MTTFNAARRKQEIIDLISRSAANAEDPALFIQELQADIQELPGAEVSFAGRSVSYLEELGYFSERGTLSLEQKHEAVYKASVEYEENSGSKDGITYEIDRILDDRHPVEEASSDMEPG